MRKPRRTRLSAQRPRWREKDGGGGGGVGRNWFKLHFFSPSCRCVSAFLRLSFFSAGSILNSTGPFAVRSVGVNGACSATSTLRSAQCRIYDRPSVHKSRDGRQINQTFTAGWSTAICPRIFSRLTRQCVRVCYTLHRSAIAYLITNNLK